MNHSGPVIATRGELSVIDCRSCGYSHLSKFPEPDALEKFYNSDFWQKEKAGALDRFLEQRDWLDAINGDVLSVAEEHTGGRRLLDVGCGYGFFMECADTRGWRGAGLDPSEEAAMYSAGKLSDKWKVLVSAWDDPGNAIPIYPCISAHWLIEHLPSPPDFLLWVKSHLSPGGVFIATIPQEWTAAQAKANEITTNKSWWLDRTHLNYFSQTSFANLLGRAGFRIVDMLASFQMELFIKDADTDYTAHPELGREYHIALEKMELGQTREQRIQAGRERARLGRGRDVTVFCRKD